MMGNNIGEYAKGLDGNISYWVRFIPIYVKEIPNQKTRNRKKFPRGRFVVNWQRLFINGQQLEEDPIIGEIIEFDNRLVRVVGYPVTQWEREMLEGMEDIVNLLEKESKQYQNNRSLYVKV